jgi:hypothetical protein
MRRDKALTGRSVDADKCFTSHLAWGGSLIQPFLDRMRPGSTQDEPAPYP